MIAISLPGLGMAVRADQICGALKPPSTSFPGIVVGAMGIFWCLSWVRRIVVKIRLDLPGFELQVVIEVPFRDLRSHEV